MIGLHDYAGVWKQLDAVAFYGVEHRVLPSEARKMSSKLSFQPLILPLLYESEIGSYLT
jgi:hypothetical protein